METRTYPAHLYGFMRFQEDNNIKVAVCTSTRPLGWEKIKTDFVSGFEVGTDRRIHFDIVPLTSIVQPLCCFEDKDGTRNKFFSLLPKHCWSEYFSDKIARDPDLDSGDEAHESGSQDEEDSVDVSTDADGNSE